MIKRRSFLAMLGIGAGAATAGAKVAVPAVEPVMPLAVEAAAPVASAVSVVVPSYWVKMPVSVNLTQEQLDICTVCLIDPVEYASNLLALKQEGKIDGPVDVNLEEQIQREIEKKKDFTLLKTI